MTGSRDDVGENRENQPSYTCAYTTVRTWVVCNHRLYGLPRPKKDCISYSLSHEVVWSAVARSARAPSAVPIALSFLSSNVWKGKLHHVYICIFQVSTILSA